MTAGPISEPTLSPRDFAAKRYQLGLSQAQLARILGVDPRTVRKWEDERDTRSPNPIACRVLKWLEAGFRPEEFPPDDQLRAQSPRPPRARP